MNFPMVCPRCDGAKVVPDPADVCWVCLNGPDENGSIEHGRGVLHPARRRGRTSYARDIPCPLCCPQETT